MALGTVYGTNYTAQFITQPPSKYPPGEFNGEAMYLCEELILSGDATAGDLWTIGTVPKGARILDCRLKCADLGGSGTIKIGNLVNAGGDAADDDSLLVGADVSGQACDQNATGLFSGALIMQKAGLLADTVIQATLPTTSGATGVKLKVYIKYIKN